MDQVHVIRHKVLVERRSARQVAKELGISRRTVRKYLTQAVPMRTETAPRPRPVWDLVRPRFDTLLVESARWTGGKQRLTATRLHGLLVAEGYRVGVSLVRYAVAEWKRQQREVFVPLTYRPGDLAEVDFFEVLVDVDGHRRKAWLFLMRLMYSGRDFAWIYERQDQVSFLDGHVRAFAHFAGVPRRIAYDNLRAAVSRILLGGERVLASRFAALASHYLFEPCFCRPGQGHDKGGVEARGKALRQQLLVPIPSGLSFTAINTALLTGLDQRLETTRDRAGQTMAARFAEEQRQWAEVPSAFESARTTVASVSRRALVRLDGAVYSVPSRWAGCEVTVHVRPETITLVGRDHDPVVHRRRRVGERAIDYRHYLPELAHKPQALRQVLPDLLRDLGAPFPAVWDRLRLAHGEREGTRLLAKILSELQRRGPAMVIPALDAVLASGAPMRLAAVVAACPAVAAVPPALQTIEIVSGSAADYDAWLRGVSA